LWKTVAILLGLGVFVFRLLALASFLVGMFDDVILRAEILGYGFAVAIGGPVAIAILAVVFTWSFPRPHSARVWV
jgi:hypothetical protein